MNYRIDIDELYGIKRRKVSRFLMGGSLGRYIEYYTNPNDPTRTYVLFDAARRANLPFMYDVGNGGLFDYTIASDNPDNVPGSVHTNTMNGNWFDPNTTYLEIDPQTGLIVNGLNGDVVFNGKDMLPIISGNYYYHPQLGWFLQTNNPEVLESYDKGTLANTIRNRLAGWGMENALYLDDDAAIDVGKAVGGSMLEGAGSIVGGEALSALLNTVNKAPWLIQLTSRYPRTTATLGTVATLVVPGIASGVQQSKNALQARLDAMSNAVREVDNHMKGITYFTEDNFNQLHGKDGIPAMIEWLSLNGYNVAKLNDGTYTIEKDYFMFPWLTDDLLEFWPTVVGGASIYASRKKANANERRLAEANGLTLKKGTLFKKADGTRTKLGNVKNVAGYIAQIAATGAMLYYSSVQSKINEKAALMVDFLMRKGYARYGTPYTVQENNYSPEVTIPGVDSVAGLQDSAATVQDYNTGQMDSTSNSSDSINENANIFKYQLPATINE